MYNQIFEKFIDNIKNSNNQCIIPQQRGAKPFSISITTQNNQTGLLVEKRVMPLDPFFPIEIFYFVIKKLVESPKGELRRGDAMNFAIGQPGFEDDTIEAEVAIHFYGKRKGDFTFRRISVIANILVRSGVSNLTKALLRLKNTTKPTKNTEQLNKRNQISAITNSKIITPQLNSTLKVSEGKNKPLPNYLINNGLRILNAPPQNINLITKKYSHEKFMDFPVMKEFYKTFPDLKSKTIQRKDVSELFRKKKYYLGFITAMIWGGINASRPRKKNEFETIDFYKVLRQDEKKVLKIINKAKALLVDGEYEKCFQFLSDKGKIEGLGHAYFTKLMYFLSYTEKRIKLKPLIFDKWTSNAYLALLIDTEQFDKIKQFYTGRIDKKNMTVSLRRNVSTTYLSFIIDMDNWASELGINSSRLEEFIFGMSLKDNKVGSNPRKQLWKIILNYYQ
ncbi:MAG: hypothetical protein K9I84_15580 [Leadbetterella sp.]|nr:hypothetical protein [Leadbetterella sp.]